MEEAANGWVQATVAGFRAMALSDAVTASDRWLAAREALSRTTSGDPLHAVSQTNAATAHVLLGQAGDAAATLAAAEQLWMKLLTTIATADIPIEGRSSAFHFGLAARNLDAFRNAQRRRFTRLCEAGLAMTRFNGLLTRGGSPAAAVPALASQLAELLGPHSPEVRFLRAAASLPSEAHARYSHYAGEIGALYSSRALSAADDWRRLEVAVSLTTLLPPGTPVDARPIKSSSQQ